MNARAYLAVRDFGNGVKVEEVVKEGSEANAARDAGYTLTPLVPVSGYVVTGPHEFKVEDCTFTNSPPRALAAAQETIESPEPVNYEQAVFAAFERLGAPQGTKESKAFIRGAEWQSQCMKAPKYWEGDSKLAAALSTPADTSEIDRLVADAGRYRILRNGQGWPAVFANAVHPEPLRGDFLDASFFEVTRAEVKS